MEEQIKTTLSKNKEGYGYKYTDIAQIHEYLESINCRYYQYIETIEGNDYIMTVPIVEGKDLPPRRGCRVVQATLQGIKNPAQEQGSALTYARRYSLLMAFGLATDDDDAASLTIEKEITQEEAEKYTLTFGKYNGRLLKEICEEDDKYINWLFGSEKTDPVVKKVITMLTGKVELSDEEEQEKLTLMSMINTLVALTGSDFEKIRETYKVKSTADMTLEQLKNCVAVLEKKKEKKDKEGK